MTQISQLTGVPYTTVQLITREFKNYGIVNKLLNKKAKGRLLLEHHLWADLIEKRRNNINEKREAR